MEVKKEISVKGAKRLFLKLGSCSRTLGFIINREFGHLKEAEERALDPLSGGIIQQGYQCGMLWGAALAAGAESCRRTGNADKATALAIITSRHILKSFVGRTKSPDCYDITQCDWTKKSSIARHFISGKVISCYKLLGRWAPEAIVAAYEGLAHAQNGLPEKCLSCASEVVRKMGGDEEEMAMVAGFAGGVGLSGNACGALAAAIWMKTLALCRQQPGKSFFTHPGAKETLEVFYKASDYEILCSKITGIQFDSPESHTDYIAGGGCSKLIGVLAES
ncbi:MAG: C_GCAxxG_C_C family protein [Bacteroidales bacterium]|nr:C_GCAxxG_C_C family protein [Bacteroidales bacterium]